MDRFYKNILMHAHQAIAPRQVLHKLQGQHGVHRVQPGLERLYTCADVAKTCNWIV